MLTRLRGTSRTTRWFLLSPITGGACLAVGLATNWSGNGVAVIVGIAAAYFAFPPMVAALIEWQSRRDSYAPLAAKNDVGKDDAGKDDAGKDVATLPPVKAPVPIPVKLSWDSRLTDLLVVLAENLDSQDLDAVRSQANVSRGRVRAARALDNAWQALLERAADEGRFDDVLNAAAAKSPEVAAAIHSYRRDT